MIEIRHKGDGVRAITPAENPLGRILIYGGIMLLVVFLWQGAVAGKALLGAKKAKLPRPALLLLFISATWPGFMLWGKALLASDEIVLDTKRNVVLVNPREGERTSLALGSVREVALQKGLQKDPFKADTIEDWTVLLVTEVEPVIICAAHLAVEDIPGKTALLDLVKELSSFIEKPFRSDFSGAL